MRIWNSSVAISVLLIGTASVVSAGTVTIPNIFTAGTAAKAADVNANFSALATAVNGSAQDMGALQSSVQTLQSATHGGVTFNIGNVSLGSLIGIDCAAGYGPRQTYMLGGECPIVLNTKNFSTGIYTGTIYLMVSTSTAQRAGTMVVPVFYYSQANCTGSKYLAFESTIAFLADQGFVVGAVDPVDSNRSYYVKGSVSSVTLASAQVPRFLNGVQQAPQCYASSDPNFPQPQNAIPNPAYYALVPNDPSVTGFPVTLSGSISLTAH